VAAGMRIRLRDGELMAGTPDLRAPTEAENAATEKAHKGLEDCPPWPGGDGGHFHPDYEKILRQGVGGILDEIDRYRAADGLTDEQKTFYDACRIAMEGFRHYVTRVADACCRRAEEPDADVAHWQRLAGTCEHVAHEPPETFEQACQLMYLVMVVSWYCEGHVMTCYGRMDRTLQPLYEADKAAGRLSPQEAMEQIACLYILQNLVCPPGLANGVIVGGRDGEGRPVVNDLTYLCLAARQATALVYPTLGIAWHEDLPNELMAFALEMIATGIGCPAMFNDGVIAGGLQDHGVSPADSHNWMNSTCVEIKTVGNSNIWVATRYFNCAGAMRQVMEQEAGGELPPAVSFDEFQQRVRDVLAAEVRGTAEYLDDVWRQRAVTGGMPWASCLISDCLARGVDHDRGGTRYGWAENSFVGLANLTDGMIAVKRLVYEDGEMTLAELLGILAQDFNGHEALRRRILNTLPTYGNDDTEADAIAAAWAGFLMDTTESCMVGAHRYVPGFFCHVNHQRLGAESGATPDGRPAGRPFADGAGAAQGRERRGPTASVLSTTCWPHRRALGGLVHNVKFSRRVFDSDAGRRAVRHLIETYLQRGGFEIQVNVVSADWLRQAQARPQDYADLLVRVAGYSDYFTHLNRAMQDEVIERTEFEDV